MGISSDTFYYYYYTVVHLLLKTLYIYSKLIEVHFFGSVHGFANAKCAFDFISYRNTCILFVILIAKRFVQKQIIMPNITVIT